MSLTLLWGFLIKVSRRWSYCYYKQDHRGTFRPARWEAKHFQQNRNVLISAISLVISPDIHRRNWASSIRDVKGRVLGYRFQANGSATGQASFVLTRK